MKYFVINDTSYDRHHGCTTVMNNLRQGFENLGHECVGTLAVGLGVDQLIACNYFKDANFIIINGEGSLHHDANNAQKILEILLFIKNSKPVFLINSTWQDNDDKRWGEALGYCSAVFVRDTSSLEQIKKVYPSAQYAPDLTFLNLRSIVSTKSNDYLIVDSVKKSWSKRALEFCRINKRFKYLTMFDGRARRTQKKWSSARKFLNWLFVFLYRYLSLPVSFEYKNNSYAILDTESYRQTIESYEGVFTGRYHTLCFCIQQNIPFLFLPSNTFKCEALLKDVGVDPEDYCNTILDNDELISRLGQVRQKYLSDQDKFKGFVQTANQKCKEMFVYIDNELK